MRDVEVEDNLLALVPGLRAVAESAELRAALELALGPGPVLTSWSRFFKELSQNCNRF